MLTIFVFIIMVCQVQLSKASATNTALNPMSTGSELLLTIREIVYSLPVPIVTGNSVEICLNSRYSQHTLSGTASVQQLSNVLYSAGKTPVTGDYRNIYVSAQMATYLYDPNNHSLIWYSDEVTDQGAFVISYDRELAFDAGVSYMPALLASVSLWESSEPAVSSCPKGIKLYFGVQEVRGLTSELAAQSSVPEGEPGWLPDPSTMGENNVEVVLADLNYVDSFVQKDLTLQQISQILWAGYGCTPHTTSGGRAGLTVPSASASYYLTKRIYLANENGLYRYHNRNPDTDMATRDHRIEQINSEDVRGSLQFALSGLPQAPCYIILCLDSLGVDQLYAQLETGFAASNILIQATAIGLGCHFKTELTLSEQESIQTATGIPLSDIPQVVVSIGPICVEFEEFAGFAEYWLETDCSGLNNWCDGADFEPDSDVDWLDLKHFIAKWLTCCK